MPVYKDGEMGNALINNRGNIYQAACNISDVLGACLHKLLTGMCYFLRKILPFASLLYIILAQYIYAATATSAANNSENYVEPVMLSANELGYDRKNALVVARGRVEIMQGDRIVLADRVTYNQNTNEVQAFGNVSLRQPNGDVLFADKVKLQDNLKAGIIRNFRARLADNSLFAAREARKIEDNITELDYAVYSPCKICEDREPFWQLKARKVVIDDNSKRVKYRDARLEFWGIPVAWTPYFSHATPDAPATAGFLTPELKTSAELGTTVKTPYYIPLARNRDITITPMFTTQEGAVLMGEYRHIFTNGDMQLRASATYPQRRDGQGNRAAGRELRGHLDGFANFTINDKWRWGAKLQRATDDTYLRRYDINNKDLLTSTLFIEGIDGRSWTNLQALSFQRLTNEITADGEPYIVPLADFWWQGEPGWNGSRFELTANSMILLRESSTASKRLSLKAAWQLPVITSKGQVFQAKASLRGDVYWADDLLLPDNSVYDGQQNRLMPQFNLLWRYPLINQYDVGSSILVEPILGLVVNSNGQNDVRIANEDSQAPEFKDSILFAENRYPGFDMVETGTILQYGARGQWRFTPTRIFSFLAGQNYQLAGSSDFPHTNAVDEKASDYAGRLALDWEQWLRLAYRFRFDQHDFQMRRNEVNLDFNLEPVRLHFDYLNLSDDPFLDDRQEIVANGSVDLTDYWTFMAGGRRDLDESEMIYANTGLRYRDECFTLFANFARSFIRDRDVEAGTSFLLRVQLKNLD